MDPSTDSSRAHRPTTCPVALSLDILGDRWTLVVIRDLFLGKSRYGEFLESPERITTNILAERLRRLESEGLVEKQAYQDNPPRHAYRLTRKGRELEPVLRELRKWGLRHMPGAAIPKEFESFFSQDAT